MDACEVRFGLFLGFSKFTGFWGFEVMDLRTCSVTCVCASVKASDMKYEDGSCVLFGYRFEFGDDLVLR